METTELDQYKLQVKNGEKDPHPYDRLMIYFRKQKEYKEELRIINRGIKVFTDQLKHQQAGMFKGSKSRASIEKLSKQISRSAGLTDKKGNLSYLPEPIARWTKRKQTVEQKLQA